MSVLRKGSRGDEVKALQQKLNIMADGIFGSLTEEAVRQFQRSKGLITDGIVGSATAAALAGVGSARRRVSELIVHCSATPEGEDFTVDQIRQWHLARGFSDVGYHYVIYRDGSVHVGRDEAIAGAHCSGHNTCSIGVCYIGGCPPRSVRDWSKQAKDTRTQAQRASLIRLLRDLRRRYPAARIYGHRDFAAKPCPSFNVHTDPDLRSL